MCSGSEAGSYPRLIDFVYHSTLGWRVIKREESLGFGVWGLGCGGYVSLRRVHPRKSFSAMRDDAPEESIPFLKTG